MNNIEFIGADDMIINNEENIHSGGFSVNSIMMKAGLSPIMTINNEMIGGNGNNENKINLFDNLVVPNFAYSLNLQTDKTSNGGNNTRNKKNYDVDDITNKDDDIIEDNLYEQLLELATQKIPRKSSNKTKNKLSKKLHNKTKRKNTKK